MTVTAAAIKVYLDIASVVEYKDGVGHQECKVAFY